MNDNNHDGADGWASPEIDRREATQPYSNPQFQEHPHRPLMVVNQPMDMQDDVEKGKAMAMISHGSLFFGLPIFLIPMLSRDNRFALHHAKAAAVIYIYCMFTVVLTLLTCGLTFPLVLLAYIPAIVGIVQAANGQLAGTWGFGSLGEALFGSLRIKPQIGIEP